MSPMNFGVIRFGILFIPKEAMVNYIHLGNPKGLIQMGKFQIKLIN